MRLILLFLLVQFSLIGQSVRIPEVLAEIVKQNYPESDLNGKSLMLSVWDPTSVTSRELNKEMYRVWHMFQRAPMIGSPKGAILICISVSDYLPFVNMALRKDSVFDVISLLKGDPKTDQLLLELNPTKIPMNYFYKSDGTEFARDIPKDFVHVVMTQNLIRKK